MYGGRSGAVAQMSRSGRPKVVELRHRREPEDLLDRAQHVGRVREAVDRAGTVVRRDHEQRRRGASRRDRGRSARRPRARTPPCSSRTATSTSASTMRPSARSLSANAARGVGRRPPRRTCDRSAAARSRAPASFRSPTNCWNSSSQTSARAGRRIARSKPGIARIRVRATGTACCRGTPACEVVGRRAPRRKHELAVVAERDALPLGEIPQVAVRRLGDVVVGNARRGSRPRSRTSAARRVVRRHRLLDVVGRVGRHRPVVPVGAHLGVDEEPVEQSEPLGERVMIRRHGARKEHQRRIAVALRDVAEHLIVRAVLLEDVDHVLERRIARPRAARVPSVRRGDARREPRERVAARLATRARASRHRRAASSVYSSVRPMLRIAVRRGLGIDPAAFAARDDRAASPTGEQRRRIPAGREFVRASRSVPDAAVTFDVAGDEIEHGDGVRVGFGDEEARAVRRERERVRRRAPSLGAGRRRIERARDHASRLGVDDRHVIGAARGDEQATCRRGSTSAPTDGAPREFAPSSRSSPLPGRGANVDTVLPAPRRHVDGAMPRRRRHRTDIAPSRTAERPFPSCTSTTASESARFSAT